VAAKKSQRGKKFKIDVRGGGKKGPFSRNQTTHGVLSDKHESLAKKLRKKCGGIASGQKKSYMDRESGLAEKGRTGD